MRRGTGRGTAGKILFHLIDGDVWHVDAELSQVKRRVLELVTGCSQDRGPGLPDSEVPVLLESEDVPPLTL